MPSIVVRVTDTANHDVTSFRVTKDGKVLLDKPSGTAIDVDPGKTTLHFEADGFVPRDLPLVVAEGEQRRLVEIVLRPVGAPEERGRAAARRRRRARLRADRARRPGWRAASASPGSASSASSRGSRRPSTRASRRSAGTPAPAATPSSTRSRTKYVASAIGLGVGAAGLATAVILYLAVDRSAKPSSSARLTPLGVQF